MKAISLIIALCAVLISAFSQKKPIVEIENMVTRHDIEAPLTFLAADEMRGRDTGSKEIDIAANYIGTYFQQLGLQKLPGADKFFQPVELETKYPAASAELKFKDEGFKFKEQFIVSRGSTMEWKGEFIYVGYGSAEETPADVKGKIVVSIIGAKETTDPRQVFSASNDKYKRIKESGAAGLIEFFVTPTFPWPMLVNRFGNSPRTAVKASNTDVPHIFLKDAEAPGLKELKELKKINGSLSIVGGKVVPMPSKNVIGKIEGTDPLQKKEHIVISAHYDHVGVKKGSGPDSIYNGARDNALGTVAMMTAARFFAKFPPKRSVIFMALTGEEKGLLGSAWYAEHPLVPLDQTVFDLDCDGAGYNDTTLVTVIGLERTSAEADINKACVAFGLKAIKDPVPEQNLYERSDNYNFAKKGVPAIDFAPGFTSFDAEISKYYHQAADEVSTLNFSYLVKFFRAFVYTNYLLANGPKAPYWNAGDKFEPVGKVLYKK